MASHETVRVHELPADPDLVRVPFDSGLEAWVLPHRRGEGRIALGLSVAAGSLCEDETERGLAHLVEHLAFRGGHHLPPGGLGQFFDDLGTRLGRHHNAATGLERTTYTLTLPTAESWAVERGLACLADFAFGLLMPEAAVEEERRVVLEEMRAHDRPGRHIRAQVLDRLAPAQRLSERHPLGAEEVVGGVDAERLRMFHRRWYRPESAVVVAVGDLDPAAVTTAIEVVFGDWQTPSEGVRYPDLELDPATTPGAFVALDPDAVPGEVATIALHRIPSHGSEAGLLHRLRLEAGLWLLRRRLALRQAGGDPPFLDSRLSITRLVGCWHTARIAAETVPDRAPRALAAVVEEVERIRRRGFTADELVTAGEHFVATAERAQRRAAVRSVDGVAGELLEHAPDRVPPPSGDQRARWIADAATRLDGDDVAATTSGALGASGCRLLFAVASVPGVDARRLEEIASEATTKPDLAVVQRTPRMRLPAPSRRPVAAESRVELASLGTAALTYANGARLRLRTMSDRPGRVEVSISLAGGRIREDRSTLGLTAAAALALSQPAFDGLPSPIIADWLATAGTAFDVSVEEDLVRLRIAGEWEAVCDGIELAHHVLVGPRLEPAVFVAWRERLAAADPSADTGAESILARRVLEIASGCDPRFQMLETSRIQAITHDEAVEWLDREILPAPLEIAIAGDFDVAEAAALGDRFLGSLPTRASTADLAPLRILSPASGPITQRLPSDPASPRAAIFVGWRAAPWHATRDRTRLTLVSDILRGRLHRELRERLGLTYDADCSYAPSRAYPSLSLLATTFYTPPERVEEGADAAVALVHDLARSGPTEAETDAARRRLHDLAIQARRSPRFWARSLSEIGLREQHLENLNRSPDELLEIAPDEVRETLERWLTPANRIVLMASPNHP